MTQQGPKPHDPTPVPAGGVVLNQPEQKVPVRRKKTDIDLGTAFPNLYCTLDADEVVVGYTLVIQVPLENATYKVLIDIQEAFDEMMSGVDMFPKIGESAKHLREDEDTGEPIQPREDAPGHSKLPAND